MRNLTSEKWYANYSDHNQREKLQVTAEDKDGSIFHICDCDVSGLLSKEEKCQNVRAIIYAPELLKQLKIMTSLCELKYGNLDKDVYVEIVKSQLLVNIINE